MKDPALSYLCDHTGTTFNQVFGLVHVYETPSGNRAQVQNGRYVVDIPTELPPMTLDVAKLKAIWTACPDTPRVSTASSFATISSGRIRGRIALADPGAYPRATPDPESGATATGVAAMLGTVKRYIATDASRVWATGVCLANGFAYATNNVVLLRYAILTDILAGTIIPVNSIDAIVAKGEPVTIGSSENAVTFYFEDGSWTRTQVVAAEWPTATVDHLIEATPGDGWEAIGPTLAEDMATAGDLSEERFAIAEFSPTGFHLVDGSFTVECGGVPDNGRVNARMAALALGGMTDVQWHCPRKDVHAFRGPNIQGVFGGTR